MCARGLTTTTNKGWALRLGRWISVLCFRMKGWTINRQFGGIGTRVWVSWATLGLKELWLVRTEVFLPCCDFQTYWEVVRELSGVTAGLKKGKKTSRVRGGKECWVQWKGQRVRIEFIVWIQLILTACLSVYTHSLFLQICCLSDVESYEWLYEWRTMRLNNQILTPPKMVCKAKQNKTQFS